MARQATAQVHAPLTTFRVIILFSTCHCWCARGMGFAGLLPALHKASRRHCRHHEIAHTIKLMARNAGRWAMRYHSVLWAHISRVISAVWSPDLGDCPSARTAADTQKATGFVLIGPPLA